MISELTRVELRRGPGVWAAILTAGLFYVAVHRYGVVLTWMDATSAIGASTQLCGPASAGVAAYCGARAIRRRATEQHRLAVPTELTITGSEFAAYATWVVGTWCVATVALLLTVWHDCHWGHPDAAWIAAAAAGLLAEIAVGFCLGRLLPYLITPPLIAIVLFVSTGYLLNHVNNWWYFLSPLNSQDWLPYDGLHTSNFVLQAAFLVGITLLSIAAAAVRITRTDRGGSSLLVVGTAMVILAAAALATGDGQFWAIDTHIVWRCSGQRPTVCVHPAFVAIQDQLTDQFDGVAARTRDTPFQVNRFEQRPRGIGSEPTPSALAFAIDAPAAIQIPNTVVDATVALLNANSCQSSGQTSSTRIEQAVVQWVSGQSVLGPDQSTPDPTADTVVGTFNRLDDAGKHTWITTHARQIRTCSFGAPHR